MSVNRSTGEADRKLVTLVGLVAVLGLAVAAGAAIVAVTGAAAPAATVAAAALLVVVGTLLDVGVRVRATRHGLSWTDAGILLGLAVLPTAWVIVVTVVSIAAVRIFERVKPMKSAFAVAKDAAKVASVESRAAQEKEVMQTVDRLLGAIARPSRVHFVSALPKTRSGKLLRRSIQALAEGRDPGDLTTIEDPAALEQIRAAIAGK